MSKPTPDECIIAELHSTPYGFYAGTTTAGKAIQVLWQPRSIEIVLDPHGAVYGNTHDGLTLNQALEQAGFTFAAKTEEKQKTA